jgi:hypothetical protein
MEGLTMNDNDHDEITKQYRGGTRKGSGVSRGRREGGGLEGTAVCEYEKTRVSV